MLTDAGPYYHQITTSCPLFTYLNTVTCLSLLRLFTESVTFCDFSLSACSFLPKKKKKKSAARNRGLLAGPVYPSRFRAAKMLGYISPGVPWLSLFPSSFCPLHVYPSSTIIFYSQVMSVFKQGAQSKSVRIKYKLSSSTQSNQTSAWLI